MSISNYTELKASIADFLNRDDLTSVIPDFIRMAEANMNRDLRHWQMEKRVTANLTTQYTAIPSDFLEGIRLTLDTANTAPLEVVGSYEIASLRAEVADTVGQPGYYTILDGSIEVFPSPDASYTLELLYYGKVPPLTDADPTNWILLGSPDLYVYGALVHSAPYLQADERIAVWSAYYAKAATALNQESEKAKTGGSGRRMKIRSY